MLVPGGFSSSSAFHMKEQCFPVTRLGGEFGGLVISHLEG